MKLDIGVDSEVPSGLKRIMIVKPSEQREKLQEALDLVADFKQMYSDFQELSNCEIETLSPELQEPARKFLMEFVNHYDDQWTRLQEAKKIIVTNAEERKLA